MSPLDTSAKRLCLWALVWGGFLAQATTELLVLGTPTVPTVKSTITITTTVIYKPSLLPGNSQYTLVGCYSQPSTDGGHIFGPGDYDACSDNVAPGNLTIDGCLRSCRSAAPPKNGTETYVYAGLRNGSECRCGVQLPTDIHKLSVDDCLKPCSGDPRLSCGGHSNVAIYSLISADGTHNKGSQSTNDSKNSPLAPTDSKAKNPTTIRPSVSSSTTAAVQSADSDETSSPPAGQPVSTPTIAAITGSFSGAIVIAAALFLCYRFRKRKKRVQDAHVKLMLERSGRRSIQSPLFPSPSIQGNVANAGHGRKNTEDSGGDGSSGVEDREKDLRPIADGDLIPSTPALEAGRKSPAGLHSRTTASAVGTRSRSGTVVAEERNIVHSALTREGASSAVQWPPSNADSGMPSTQSPVHRRASSNTIAAPPPLARIDGLGERAWHRRKLSTPFQPAVGVGLGSIARNGPPSDPPTAPLPPKPGARARSQSRSRHGPRDTSKTRPPPRSRRSFDTMVFGPEQGDLGELAGLGIVGGTSKESALGMSHGNTSTPSLGRYGSLSKARRPIIESPVLGWQAENAQSQWGALPREAKADDGQPQLPVLPPVAPGERFDHKRWRGTIYAEPHERFEGAQQGERHGQQSRGGELSPMSVSSVGTSILFGPDEFDRRL
ncbi:hypothetical protein GGR58DRAFT_451331 [Xylaria digitata]|nr:hypothetical protein GGR58DRAFT_451331 [Xylaria digitata]